MKPQLNGYNVSKCRSDGSTGGRKDDDGDADDKKYVVTHSDTVKPSVRNGPTSCLRGREAEGWRHRTKVHEVGLLLLARRRRGGIKGETPLASSFRRSSTLPRSRPQQHEHARA